MQSYIAQINGVDTVQINIRKDSKATFKSLRPDRFQYVPANDRPTLESAARWLASQAFPASISGLDGGWSCVYPKGRADLAM